MYIAFLDTVYMRFLTFQIRDEIPELKAIVQYKGELSQDYPEVYNVCIIYTYLLCVHSARINTVEPV